MSVLRADSSPKTPNLDLKRAIDRIRVDESIREVSRRRVTDLLDSFSNFLAASGGADLREIRPSEVDAFVRSLTGTGAEPSLATMHLRRTALRVLFREAMASGLIDSDPSAGITLPKRTYHELRPLADAEVERCRATASTMLGDLRFAIAWALAEATARVPELGQVRTSDFDPETASVHLPGCSSTEPRWTRLTAWGLGQIEAAVSRTESADAPILRHGSRAGAHELIAGTLRRAGLGGTPEVRPNSVVAWRGDLAMRNGATIDQVTRLLGMRSLDRTAAFIGFDWKGGEA